MKPPIYLDHHATTPCAPSVVDDMLPWFTERFGNAASRIHAFAEDARRATEAGRKQVAGLVGGRAREVVFTSGATEANNLAIFGVANHAETPGHLVVSSIEHKAVLDPARHLARHHGWSLTELPVDFYGRVNPSDVAEALRDDTRLVSVMWANNEVGTIQPISEIGAICRARGVLFHTDAVQAAAHLPIDVGACDVDLLSLSAHKMYGPKGIGALWVRRGGHPRVRLQPLLHGGGHERGMRSGTLPVPLIVGFGAAADLARRAIADGEARRVRELRDHLADGLLAIGGVTLNGHPTERLPQNLHISIDRVEAQALMVAVVREVACSSGSACSSATLEPSHVLRAMGIDPERAHASLRFGLGRTTSADDIQRVLEVFSEQVPRLRALTSLLDEEAPAEALVRGGLVGSQVREDT